MYTFVDSGDDMYIWKVNLDGTTHNPDTSTIVIRALSTGANDARFIGLKQTLVSGNVHGIYHHHDSKIYYFDYNWGTGIKKALQIGKSDGIPAFAVFAGSKTEVDSRLGLTLYEALFGTYQKAFDAVSQNFNLAT